MTQELIQDIILWEKIRRVGNMNMFGMGGMIGNDRAVAVMHAYNDGSAKAVIAEHEEEIQNYVEENKADDEDDDYFGDDDDEE
jgi:hypothetical protein